jgi:CheY-like chemotaxis protein
MCRAKGAHHERTDAYVLGWLAALLLEKRGYQVEVVGTGQAALAIIDRLLC